MTLKQLLINLGKLLLCGVAFFVGVVVGGVVASSLGLQPPRMPEGFDATTSVTYLMLESPLLALALALLATGLSGSFLTRASILSFLTWIAYTVNTQLEASIFMAFSGGFWFTVIDFLVPSLLCGAAVAFLFPPDEQGMGFIAALRAFFGRRAAGAWAWRLAVAVVAFMPIYFFFGLLVVPFTSEYYRQNLYGLQMPSLNQILPILFVRSVLFLLACLPVIVVWQKSAMSLFLRLGFALFVLVGLLGLLAAYWIPVSVRLPHTLEILADEFVYAGVLVLLLARHDAPARQKSSELSGARGWADTVEVK